MNISIFGLGYVGSVSCACLAERGHHIIGVDTNPAKVDLIRKGQSPVVEDSIEELMAAALSAGRLSATMDADAAVAASEVSLISVATPSNPDFTPDLQAVDKVIRSIGMALAQKPGHHTVVLRSTVPPGTTGARIQPILEHAAGRKVGDRLSLVFNPEFLREGSSVNDFYHPPQTVIGSLDDAGYSVIEAMYKGLPGPVVRTNWRVAESVKYLCNVFHALKIVFANEAGAVLKTQGIDAREVMRVFCQDTQLNISTAYLRPGFAFGGSCLPKEVKGFLALAKSMNVDIPVLAGLLDSNSAHIDRAYALIAQGGRRKVALFGLAFKPGTDDLRDSPLVQLAERLIGKGYEISIYDSHVKLSQLLGRNREFIDREIPHLDKLLLQQPAEVLAGAEVVVVGHADAAARLEIVAQAAGKCIIDLTGCDELRHAGAAHYEGICW